MATPRVGRRPPDQRYRTTRKDKPVARRYRSHAIARAMAFALRCVATSGGAEVMPMHRIHSASRGALLLMSKWSA